MPLWDFGLLIPKKYRFGAVDRGWKVRYVPLCLATGVCPPTPRSFFSQQMRWARGSTTLLTNGHFWVSNLTFVQKVCYLCGKPQADLESLRCPS